MAIGQRYGQAHQKDHRDDAIEENRASRVVFGEYVRAGKHEKVHHDVDESSVGQPREDSIPPKQRQEARCQDKECSPDQCDKQVKGKSEKRGAKAARVCAAAQNSACDGLRDLNGRYAAKSKEEDGVEYVENRGDGCAHENSLQDRPTVRIWHAEF